MRYLVFILLSMVVISCKKKAMLKKVEGRWQMTKTLMDNGTYVTEDKIYEFSSGKPDQWLPLFVYGADTTICEYKPSSIQHKLLVSPVNNVDMQEIWTVEDADKKNLVIHDSYGVHFFEKVN
jgi:hypothetical protein